MTVRIYKWGLQLNQETDSTLKVMVFYRLQRAPQRKLVTNMVKNLMDAAKIASKRAAQKIAEATGDLTGNKVKLL